MQPRRFLLPAASALSLAVTACTGGGGLVSRGNNPSGTGPFDSRGNYVEAWADNPSQWRKGSTQVVEATPDRPAADVPVSATAVAANTTPARPNTTTVVYRKPTTPTTTRPAAKPVVKTTPKPKPKPVVKVKPKTTRHSVRAGDNLYNIAKRYGTSVSAIQKANGIKGSMIRPGQSLVIPR
jgi:LysM repeat protein